MPVSDTDRAYLARLQGGQSLGQTRDALAEGRLLEPQVNMELEFNDVLKGNSFGVKFVAMQTPTSLPAKMSSLPSKVFFTFKFYTFNMVQTDAVQLRLSKQIEETLSSQKSVSFDPKIELARKYYLV